MAWKWNLTWMAVFAVVLTGLVRADEISQLRKEQEKLYNQLAEMNNRLMKLESSQQEQGTKITRMEENGGFEIPETLAWLEKIKIYGDFRYRHEWTDDETKTADRNRHRIQARIGLKGTVNDEIGYNFRLSSGNSESPTPNEGSPTSNNQDIGNAFSSKNIWLDLAYFDYHPAGIPGLNVYGGKILNPHYCVGNSDLLFDSDVTPEGIAAAYKTKLSDGVELFGTVGGYYVKERSTDADTSLWAVQAGGIWRFGEEKKSHLIAGAGYYDYGNVKGRAGLGSDSTQFYGNRSTGGLFDSDFDLVQGFAELGAPLGDLPVRFFGDAVKNIRAESSQDTAWLAGASLGKCAKPGTWAFVYNYRDVEADSLLGVLTEATFGGGGTDVKGHKFSYNYQLAENTQLGLTYMAAERTRDDETTDYDVVYTDFTIKF